MPVAATSTTRALIFLRQSRELAESTLPLVPSSLRDSARWRLRRLIRGAGAGEAPPKPDTRTPVGAPALMRRWCPACGCELGGHAGRGRPTTACRPETGRPCKRLVSRCHDIARIAQAAEPTERRTLRLTAREWASEIGT